MQVFVVLAAVIAAASAGGITGYSTGNYVQHAHAVSAVGVAPVGYAAAPVGLAGVGYAHAPVAYAAPVAKAISPVAQSTAFVNRAPAARVLAAAPIGVGYAGVGYAAPALAGVGYAAPAVAGYGAPILG